MKKLFYICIVLSQCINAQKIKIAIFEDLVPRWFSNNYQKNYLSGINLEVNAAKKLGINYEYKTFFSANTNIFEQVKEIKKWNPDVVIGPTFSTHFLLLKDQFTDILVLSPYASSDAVYEMPKNYYTLTSPATFKVKNTNKKSKPIVGYIFTEVSCTFCVDFAKIIVAEFKKKNIKINQIEFIDDNLTNKQLDYKTLLKNHHENDIIILNTSGYQDELLISGISNNIKKSKIMYIVGDAWDMYNNWDTDNVKTNYTFNVVRITPKILHEDPATLQKFTKQYFKLYNKTPSAIAFATFNTLNSVSDVLKTYNCHLKNNKANILCSYQTAIKKNPQWHRPNIHEIYKIKIANGYFIIEIKWG
jgi:hypothetical protein